MYSRNDAGEMQNEAQCIDTIKIKLLKMVHCVIGCWWSIWTPDSQSREPGFQSPSDTVSKLEHFRSLLDAPVHSVLSDSGGNVNNLCAVKFCVTAILLSVANASCAQAGSAPVLHIVTLNSDCENIYMTKWLLSHWAWFCARAFWSKKLIIFISLHKSKLQYYVV